MNGTPPAIRPEQEYRFETRDMGSLDRGYLVRRETRSHHFLRGGVRTLGSGGSSAGALPVSSMGFHTIHLWHDRVPVPAAARTMVRAQRIQRLRGGATADDHYLIDDGRRIPVRRFASMALAALEEVGHYVPWAKVRDRPAEEERWPLERGVAIRGLPECDPAPRPRTDGTDPELLIRDNGSDREPSWRLSEGHQPKADR